MRHLPAKLKLLLGGIFGIAIVLSSCLSDVPTEAVAPVSPCIQRAVSNREVIEHRILDLNGDGEPDEVALVQDDNLYVLASLGTTTPTCELVLNEPLTHLLLTDGRQNIEVNAIESVEVTGKGPPELYIWVDKEGGGRGGAKAIHSIFVQRADGWTEVLRLEGCLPFSSLQFQPANDQSKKAIYFDNDLVCDTLSGERPYTVYEWNGAEFIAIEKGIARKWSFSGLLGNSYMIVLLLLLIPSTLILLAVLWQHRGARHQH